MSISINQKSLRAIGILVAIIGGLVAFIGGAKAATVSGNIWSLLAAMALAAIGGLIAAIGGYITNLLKK
jgi:4-hydroxybenzoate polyprenyltransferase